MKRTTVFAVLLLIANGAVCQQPKAKRQNSFNIEENVDRPAPLPSAVLNILKKDPIVAMCPDDDTARAPFASWFEASEVSLSNSEAPGLLVKPTVEGGCLMGANMGPFWVFRHTRNGYQLVLSESGLGLEIVRRRNRTHADIELGAAIQAGAVVVYRLYRFREGKYRFIQRREERNE